MPRIPLSVTQNFLKESVIDEVFTKHVRIPTNHTVIDIGAGTGNITSWLAKHTQNQILAYELDKQLSDDLRAKFGGTNRVSVLNKNFLYEDELKTDFVVVANIPYMYTTSILKQLKDEQPFSEGYIIMQQEAAWRFGGYQVKQPSSMQSILLGIDFSVEILHTFAKKDFTPAPNVISVLVHLKRHAPLVIDRDRIIFEDFVAYLYNKSVPIVRKAPTLGRFLARKIDLGRTALLQHPPSELSLDDYVYLFSLCDQDILEELAGYMESMREQGESVEKVYRTRQAPAWKRVIQ